MKKKIPKICFVIGALDKGGAEVHLTRVLPDLASNGFDVSVFCFARKGELACILEKGGVKVISSPLFGALAKRHFIFKPLLFSSAVLSFLFHIFCRRIDVIHFFLPASYLLMGPVSLLHWRSKKLMSRRSLNCYQQKYPEVVRKLELWLHDKMHCIVGNSERVVEELIKDEKVPENKLRLIYNGIVLKERSSKDRARIRASLGIPHDVVVMVIVANLIPYKGHRDLLEACALMERQDWYLLIVGGDATGIGAALEAFVQEANLQNRVRFLGARNDVEDLLTASDVGLLVSHEEGFSNAILEGMAAQLPMIVTDVGGNAEAVTDSVNGIVVPPRNTTALKNAMDLLLDSDTLRDEMGKEGFARARDEFSHEKCVEKYIELYRSI